LGPSFACCRSFKLRQAFVLGGAGIPNAPNGAPEIPAKSAIISCLLSACQPAAGFSFKSVALNPAAA
jgi:hypothetical protein